jgi:hypothetical protein
MEKPSSKRRRPSVSRGVSRALNTNRNKKETNITDTMEALEIVRPPEWKKPEEEEKIFSSHFLAASCLVAAPPSRMEK